MKLLTPSALLAAALLCAALVVPFHGPFSAPARPFYFEATVASTQSGHVQVYYDSGFGFTEKASVLADLPAGPAFHTYRLALPPGAYGQLRFDPIDRDGTVTIAAVRILDADGHPARTVPLAQFQPLNQIQSLTTDAAGLQVVVTPGGDDPQLLLRFDPPLAVPTPRDWRPWVRPLAAPALALWVATAAALFAAGRSPGLRAAARAPARWVAAHPGPGLGVVAALAVVASCYPVVFLHRSFVSPDVGTLLLYDEMPTLPGDGQARTTAAEGSDVGAIMWQQVAMSAIQHRAVLGDHAWPLWNRYDSAGTPLLGQGQSMWGDPLHLLVVAANGAAWAWDLKFLLAKWLLACGLGLAVATLTRSAPAAWLTAAAAPFYGYFLYRLNHPAFFSFCYSVWPLYCWLRLGAAPSGRSAWRWAIALILADAILLASGTVKEAYLLAAVLNLAGAAAWLAAPAAPGHRARRLAAIAGGALVTAALTAPLWYSFLDTLRVAHTSYDTPAAFQIQPGLLLGFFDEAFYRPLTQHALVFNPASNFLVLGGLLYFLATLRQQCADRRVLALALCALVPLAFAFGLVPPGWIVRWPFLGRIEHIDNTFSCPLIILTALLAGLGYAAAARRLGTPEGAGDLGIAGLLLFGLGFAYTGFAQAVHRSVQAAGPTLTVWAPGESLPVDPLLWLYLALLIGALAGLALVARRGLQRGQLSAAGVILALTCGYVLLWRMAQEPPAAAPSAYWYRPGKRLDFHAPSGAIRRVQQGVRAVPGRAIGLQNNFFAGWTAMYGLEGVEGPDALMDPAYRDLTELTPLFRDWDWRLYVSRGNLAPSRPFLDFLNVRYYFDLRSDQGALGKVLRLVQTGDLDVYESPTAWPRAFFTDRLWRYRQPADLVRHILEGDGQPFAAAAEADLPPGAPPLALPPELAGRTVVPATGYQLTENKTTFAVNAPRPGLAVLSETGWAGYGRAELDGHAAPLYPINHAFLGIFLPAAGLHQITVTYAPRHWPLLELVSAAAALLLLAAAVGTRARPAPRSS